MTKIKTLTITDRFWAFIEEYLPGYHEREDILRQANLQLYVDGHESGLAMELSVDEAKAELHRILCNVYFEAIEAYTKRLHSGCEICDRHNTKYCPACGKRTDNHIIENPFRCAECGSTDIQHVAWVDTNTYEYKDLFLSDDQDKSCEYCDEHTRQIPESELMEDIAQWWKQLDGETMEIITGLEHESYCTEPDQDIAFDKACNDHWMDLDKEQKIAIWKHYTYDNRDE